MRRGDLLSELGSCAGLLGRHRGHRIACIGILRTCRLSRRPHGRIQSTNDVSGCRCSRVIYTLLLMLCKKHGVEPIEGAERKQTLP